MLNNQTRRQILSEARQTGFQGSVLDLFQLAEQGADVSGMLQSEAQAKQQQQQMQVAQTAKEQEVGLREEHARGNTGASMAFPNVAPNQAFNTEGMKVPINISKVDEQGHLVQSFNNVPPGIKNLPTGPKRGTVIETPAYKNGGYKGYKQKYQNAGFKLPPLGSTNLDVRGLINQELNNQNTSLDTNPAANIVQQNQVTDNLLTEDKNLYKKKMAEIEQNKKNNVAPSSSDIALIKAGPEAQFNTKNIIEANTFKPQEQGEFRDVVKDNMRDVMANSFLASQIASGYGGDYINQSLQDQNNYEEKFDNLLSGTGQKTMQQIALSTMGVSSSASLARNPASTNFAKRALAYPTDKTAKGINTLLTTPGVKGKLGTSLNTLYNYGYISGLPKVLSSTAEAGVGYSAGEKSGQEAGLQIGVNALNYIPAVKGFNTANRYIQPVAQNYGKIKTVAKAGYDLYKGNPEDAALRMTELVGGGNSKYYKKYLRKLIPDNVKSDITKGAIDAFVPKVYGGQPSKEYLNFKGK